MACLSTCETTSPAHQSPVAPAGTTTQLHQQTLGRSTHSINLFLHPYSLYHGAYNAAHCLAWSFEHLILKVSRWFTIFFACYDLAYFLMGWYLVVHLMFMLPVCGIKFDVLFDFMMMRVVVVRDSVFNLIHITHKKYENCVQIQRAWCVSKSCCLVLKRYNCLRHQ